MKNNFSLYFCMALLISLQLSVASAQANDVDCSDFSTQKEAQAFFEAQGGSGGDSNRLDSDGDGLACEDNQIGINSDATVVGVVAGTPDFSTLVSALTAAGLTETLQGSGPFTVFAPTNEAFAKLSEADLNALLADRAALTRVLTYHVVPGSFTTADITEDMKSFATLEGSPLPITQQGVGDAAVTAVNIPASNGVVFAIDTVLTPPAAAATSSAESGGAGGLYSSTAEASERYTLGEANGSGVSGSVLVAEYSGNRTVVSISLLGTPSGGVHPADLYLGSCNDLSRVVASLEPVSGDTGFSTTVLDLPFSDVVGGNHALNVTASEGDSAAVTCGEVGQ